MTFNESNTVEAFVRDRLCGGITHHTAVGPGLARRTAGLRPRLALPRAAEPPAPAARGPGRGSPARGADPAEPGDRRAARPRRRGPLQAARDPHGRPQRRPRQGQRGVRRLAHRRAVDAVRRERRARHDPADRLRRPRAATSTSSRPSSPSAPGQTEKRADLVLLVNGIPLVVIEAKTPVRASQSWLDGALQVHDDYERNVPELFVPNVFSVATEGKEFRYGSIGMPVELWGPWRIEADDDDAGARSSRRGGRRRCCGPTSCSTCWPTSPRTRPTRRSAGSRSSPATSSTRPRTRSSSASSPATRRRA